MELKRSFNQRYIVVYLRKSYSKGIADLERLDLLQLFGFRSYLFKRGSKKFTFLLNCQKKKHIIVFYQFIRKRLNIMAIKLFQLLPHKNSNFIQTQGLGSPVWQIDIWTTKFFSILLDLWWPVALQFNIISDKCLAAFLSKMVQLIP